MKNKDYRIDKPMDYLHRRLFLNNGSLMHEFFNFPGKYEGPCPNMNLDGGGSISEVDIAYMAKIGDDKFIINVEDETCHVNESTLLKIDKYRINHRYAYNLPVLSIIITSLPIDKCLKELKISASDILRPLLISYLDFDGEKILSSLKDKINNNLLLTRKEFVMLIILIRTFDHNHSDILEEICCLIKKANMDDFEFKMEMVYCSRYIIHKFAESVDDIKRLEKVVGLQEAVTCGSIIEDIKNEGRQEGRQEGIIEGRQEGIMEGSLRVLNKLAYDSRYCVDELVEMFDFTAEQILNWK